MKEMYPALKVYPYRGNPPGTGKMRANTWNQIVHSAYLLGLIVVARYYRKIVRHGAASLVRQRAGRIIRNPAMNSSPSGIDPEDMLEPEVLP